MLSLPMDRVRSVPLGPSIEHPRAKRSTAQVAHGCRELLVCAARNGFAGGCFAVLSRTAGGGWSYANKPVTRHTA